MLLMIIKHVDMLRLWSSRSSWIIT